MPHCASLVKREAAAFGNEIRPSCLVARRGDGFTWYASLTLALLLLAGCDNAPKPEVVPEAAATPQSAQAEPAPVPRFKRGVLKVGDVAPNFELYDLAGNVVTLAEYRGSIVFLNFWATWCGPCRVEMPAMEALYREFDRKDFEILAVSTDQQGVAVTRPFQNQLGLTFPILHDTDYRVGLAYGARSLPMTFVIDRRGAIMHRIFGARDWESPEAKQMIKTALIAR
ncbi:MAG: TlpA family protein disulfide reductase [Nitrospira sp.]|nr:TlpA family protein disulfide reductase [Nitrospira sp.]